MEDKTQKRDHTQSLSRLEFEAERLLESAIEHNLALTYEQRIEAHENARQLMSDLQKAGECLRAQSESSA